MKNEELMTVAEAAKILGISRVAVFKRIKKGRIKATKMGRNYVISRKDLSVALKKTISPSQKEKIAQAVKKTVKEYGDVLKKLGNE